MYFPNLLAILAAAIVPIVLLHFPKSDSEYLYFPPPTSISATLHSEFAILMIVMPSLSWLAVLA